MLNAVAPVTVSLPLTKWAANPAIRDLGSSLLLWPYEPGSPRGRNCWFHSEGCAKDLDPIS